MINKNSFSKLMINGRYCGEIIKCAKCNMDMELKGIQKTARCYNCNTFNVFKEGNKI